MAYEKSKNDTDKQLLAMADALKPGMLLLQERVAKGKFAIQGEKDPAKKEDLQELLTYIEDAMTLARYAREMLTKQRILMVYPADLGDIVVDTKVLSPQTVALIRAAERKGIKVAGIERIPQVAQEEMQLEGEGL